eukprot:jgi/Mesvir1/4018/Mv03710-RA.1
MAPSVVQSFSLGSLGSLLGITPAKDIPGSTEHPSHLTVVLDRSGSMGSWVERSLIAVHGALLQLGRNPEEQLTLITFDDASKRVTVDGGDPTIDHLATRLKDIRCRGSTNLAGTFSILLDVIRSHGAHEGHVILVLSDGEVSDGHATALAAQVAVDALAGHRAPITGCLLRLMTSEMARPDTRALACVGSLFNTSKAAVIDVDVALRGSEEVSLLLLTQAIVEGLASARGGPTRMVKLAAPGVAFRRFPGAEPIRRLHLPCGATTYVLVERASGSSAADAGDGAHNEGGASHNRNVGGGAASASGGDAGGQHLPPMTAGADIPLLSGDTNTRVEGGDGAATLPPPPALAWVSLGDHRVPVTDMGVLTHEESVAAYLEFVEQQIKMWALVGGEGRAAATGRALTWFDQLDAILVASRAKALQGGEGGGTDAFGGITEASLQEDGSGMPPGGAGRDVVSVMARARALAKTAKARSASVISRVRQLRNVGRLDHLNAQQQADWLRGAQDTRSGRQLAKRALARAGGQDDGGGVADMVGAARDAVAILAEAIAPSGAEGGADSSNTSSQASSVGGRDGTPGGGASGLGGGGVGPGGKGAIPLDEDKYDDGSASFYSRSSFRECLHAAAELAPEAGQMGLNDIVTCVGGVGVAIRARVGDYVDPWTFRVDMLFAGVSLAESDLWLVTATAQEDARQGGGNAGVPDGLECPGRPGCLITGVIPLRVVDAEAYDLYSGPGVRPLMEMHASTCMRRMLAPVPGDVIAMTTAGALHLLQSLGARGAALPEVEARLLAAFLGNLCRLIGPVYRIYPYEELFRALAATTDTRTVLTAARDVSGILKPVAALLRLYDKDKPAATPVEAPASSGAPKEDPEPLVPCSFHQGHLAHVLRSLFHLDCYMSARRAFRDAPDKATAREAAVQSLLAIDTRDTRKATPLAPLFEPELVPPPAHYDQLPDGPLSALPWPAWVPDHTLDALLGLEAVLNRRAAPADPTAVFGCPREVLRAVGVVQGILCGEAGDRVDADTGKCRLPDITSEEDAVAYLRSIVRARYQVDYVKRAASKRAAEEREAVAQAVARLMRVGSLEEFMEGFGVARQGGPAQVVVAKAGERPPVYTMVDGMPSVRISNRQHPGFSQVMAALTDVDAAVSTPLPFQSEKIGFVLAGRDVREGDAGEPLWEGGNIFRGDWAPFQRVLEQLPNGAHVWAWLEHMRSLHKGHRYRGWGTDVSLPNRHGHSNDFVSFFGLGFATMAALRAAVPLEQYDDYVQRHCVEKGCCLEQARKEKPAPKT